MWLTVRRVINMLDGEALRHVITEENRIISPEIAISIQLRELEGEARAECRALRLRATQLTMNKAKDPSPAAEELGSADIDVSRFADSIAFMMRCSRSGFSLHRQNRS